eukprot:4467503-Prymnesium_polylepis.1
MATRNAEVTRSISCSQGRAQRVVDHESSRRWPPLLRQHLDPRRRLRLVLDPRGPARPAALDVRLQRVHLRQRRALHVLAAHVDERVGAGVAGRPAAALPAAGRAHLRAAALCVPCEPDGAASRGRRDGRRDARPGRRPQPRARRRERRAERALS